MGCLGGFPLNPGCDGLSRLGGSVTEHQLPPTCSVAMQGLGVMGWMEAVMETLRMRSRDDGVILLTRTFFLALLSFSLRSLAGSKREGHHFWMGRTGLSWRDTGMLQASPQPQAEVLPFPVGTASCVPIRPPGSVCKALLCALLFARLPP